MSEDRTHHVTVRLCRGYQFVAEFNDIPDAQSILLDEPPPLGEGRAPNAVDLLSAAIGNCLAASLTFCLRRARIEVQSISASVTTNVSKDEHGRLRISGIDVELDPVVDSKDVPLVGCPDLFEEFCTVTASIKRGIPVQVSLKDSRDQGRSNCLEFFTV
jgi:uncharacterized OsmC-like protein